MEFSTKMQHDYIERRKRSVTFGEYESVLRDGDDETLSRSERVNHLVMSPLRSVVSGSAMRSKQLTRQRSGTWHGAALYSNQIAECGGDFQQDVPAQLKHVLQEIITKELSLHLGDNCELTCGDEFVKKSSVISKAIGEKARAIVDCSGTKIVSCVFIGEIRGDGIEVASQCLLDVNQDAFACGNFKTATIFAVGTLFVVPAS